MKVEMKIIDLPYNQYGCGYRIQFLIKYNRKGWTKRKNTQEQSIHLNRGLNKLIEYWNYYGVVLNRDKKKKNYGIKKKEIWTAFGDFEQEINVNKCKDCKYYEGFHGAWCQDKGLNCVNQSKFKPKQTEKKEDINPDMEQLKKDGHFYLDSRVEKELPKRENGLNHSHGINSETSVSDSKTLEIEYHNKYILKHNLSMDTKTEPEKNDLKKLVERVSSNPLNNEIIFNDCVGICFTCEDNKTCQIPKAKLYRNESKIKQVYKHTITIKKTKRIKYCSFYAGGDTDGDCMLYGSNDITKKRKCEDINCQWKDLGGEKDNPINQKNLGGLDRPQPLGDSKLPEFDCDTCKNKFVPPLNDCMMHKISGAKAGELTKCSRLTGLSLHNDYYEPIKKAKTEIKKLILFPKAFDYICNELVPKDVYNALKDKIDN